MNKMLSFIQRDNNVFIVTRLMIGINDGNLLIKCADNSHIQDQESRFKNELALASGLQLKNDTSKPLIHFKEARMVAFILKSNHH